MALEDIKSPLPPRRLAEETTTEDGKDNLVSEPVTRGTVEEEEETAIVSNPVVKPQQKSLQRFLIWGGIGLLIIVIVLLVFKVIIPKIGGNKTETVINYWGLWEEPAIIEGVIADYESKNPGIKINYVRNQKTNYRTRLQARLENGEAATDGPDIFRYHASWIPMFKNDLAKVPADTAKNIGLDTDYFETYKSDIKQAGSWLGVPLMYDGLALYYNKDLINSAQVQLPQSWWDLETAANKLTVRDANGKITVAGAALGLVDNVDHWSDIVGLMMKQGGVNILATDENNTKKMKDVLTFYTLFRTKDHVWDEMLPTSTESFANGKLAFYFAPSWRVFNLEEMKTPELKYGITTVPQLQTVQGTSADQASINGELTDIHWSTYWVEGVNPKSKVQKEAWRFLEFLSTKENLEKMYAAAAQTRNFGEIYPRKSMSSQMAQNSQIEPFVKAADKASGWYLSSRTSDDNGINETMSKYFSDAINSMVFKSMTADQVASDLRNGINQMVQKYGLN